MAHQQISQNNVQMAMALDEKKRREAANAKAAGALNLDVAGEYAANPNRPHMPGADAIGRFRDMGMRQQSRLGSALAAVQAVKQRQAQEQEVNAAKMAEHDNLLKYGGTKTLTLPNGQTASSTYGAQEHNPKMYIGPKTDNPQMLQGEALQEVFQRASNAGSPNAGKGFLPNVEPGYGGTKLTDDALGGFRTSEDARRSKLTAILQAVQAKQKANLAQGSEVKVVPSVNVGNLTRGAKAQVAPSFQVGNSQYGADAKVGASVSTGKRASTARPGISPEERAKLAAKFTAGTAVDRLKGFGINAANAINQVNPLAAILGLKDWWKTPR